MLLLMKSIMKWSTSNRGLQVCTMTTFSITAGLTSNFCDSYNSFWRPFGFYYYLGTSSDFYTLIPPRCHPKDTPTTYCISLSLCERVSGCKHQFCLSCLFRPFVFFVCLFILTRRVLIWHTLSFLCLFSSCPISLPIFFRRGAKDPLHCLHIVTATLDA